MLHVASARAYAKNGEAHKSIRHALRAKELLASFGENDAQKKASDVLLSEVFGSRKPWSWHEPLERTETGLVRYKGRPRSKFILDESTLDKQNEDDSDEESDGNDEDDDTDDDDTLSWDDVAIKAEYVLELMRQPPRQRLITAGFGEERFWDVFYSELKELRCMQAYVPGEEGPERTLRVNGSLQLIRDIREIARFIAWKAKSSSTTDSTAEVDTYLQFLRLFAFSLIEAVQIKRRPSATSEAGVSLVALGAGANGWRALKRLLESGEDASTFIASESQNDRGKLSALFAGAKIGERDDAETCGRKAYKRIMKEMSARASQSMSAADKSKHFLEWARRVTRMRKTQSGLLGDAAGTPRLGDSGGVRVRDVAIVPELRVAPRFVQTADDTDDERTVLSRLVQNNSHSWPLVGGTYQDYVASMDTRHLSAAWVHKNELSWLSDAGIGVERIRALKRARREVIREYQRNMVYKMRGIQDDAEGILTAEVDSAKLMRFYHDLELTAEEKDLVATLASQKQFLDCSSETSGHAVIGVAESTVRLTGAKRRSLCDALIAAFNDEPDPTKYTIKGLSNGLQNQAERIHATWPLIVQELKGTKSRAGPLRKQVARRRDEVRQSIIRANDTHARAGAVYGEYLSTKRRRKREAQDESTLLARQEEDSIPHGSPGAARVAMRRALEDDLTRSMREYEDEKVRGRAARALRRATARANTPELDAT